MGIFSWLGGGSNPSKHAKREVSKIPEMIKPYYEPYIGAGQNAQNILTGQYDRLLNDPGAFINQIGGGYQQSPGFDFALQRALQATGNAQAAGGMAGSPQHEYQNMDIATQLANQDYNNWIRNALGMYQTGLGGYGDINKLGYGAASELAQNIGNAQLNKANLEYAGHANQNQLYGGLTGNLIGAFTGYGMPQGQPGQQGQGQNNLMQTGLNAAKAYFTGGAA